MSLWDEKLSIRVDKLEPRQLVTLHLSVTNGTNLKHDALISYTADEDGTLDLDSAAPEPGAAISPSAAAGSMDLFRSLRAEQKMKQRFWSDDVTRPYECKLAVYPGSRTQVNQEEESGDCLTKVGFRRKLLSDGIERRVIREGRVVGTMFIPPCKQGQKKPCIITIHGGHNKKSVVEDNAALLASRLGIPTLALAFFGVEGLPRHLFGQPIDVTYFEEAIDLVRSMDEVREDMGVGMWGISKGGEVTLASCALLGDKIRSAVAVNSIMKPFMVDFTYGDKETIKAKSISSDYDPPEFLSDDLASIAGMDGDYLEADGYVIPFHRSPADLLLVAGDDDQLVRSHLHADMGAEVMRSRGKTNFRVLKYSGLGHLVDIPYAPVTYQSLHPLVPPPMMLVTGGHDLAKHSFGQEDSWTKTLEFFKLSLQL